jgi:hypothetical protein
MFGRIHGTAANERRDAKRLRGPEIDDELKARRMFDWQIARIGTL